MDLVGKEIHNSDAFFMFQQGNTRTISLLQNQLCFMWDLTIAPYMSARAPC